MIILLMLEHAANSFKPPESKKDKSWPPTFIHDIRFKLHKLHKIEFRISGFTLPLDLFSVDGEILTILKLSTV